MSAREVNRSGSTGVQVDDLAELVALDKVLREAKFGTAPVDATIAASPIVADLSRRVRDAINVQTYGAPNPVDREDMIRPEWREWAASVQAANRLTSWHAWTYETKTEVARDLLSPFGLSDQILALFIDEVDSGRD